MSVRITKHSIIKGFQLNDRRCGLIALNGNMTGLVATTLLNTTYIPNMHYSMDKPLKRDSSIFSSSSWPSSQWMNSTISGQTQKILPHTRAVLHTSEALLKTKADLFFAWYDNVTHTDEIRDAHQKVNDLQDKLNEAQIGRRELSKELNDLRYELQLCYADIANCQRGEPRYLDLIRKEYDIHKKVEQKDQEFKELDKLERDLFIHLQAAVKTSHEKEKVHTNSAKYWSIVGTLAGALLGICGTAFSFYNRNDLLADINKRFIAIGTENKQIGAEIKNLKDEQRDLFSFLRSRDQKQLEEIARLNVKSKKNKSITNSESWAHWIGRKTYVISAYRYFVPNTKN